MQNPMTFGLIAGLFVGLAVGVLIRMTPVDAIVPDSLNGIITGGVAGAVAVIVYLKRKNKN